MDLEMCAFTIQLWKAENIIWEVPSAPWVKSSI